MNFILNEVNEFKGHSKKLVKNNELLSKSTEGRPSNTN